LEVLACPHCDRLFQITPGALGKKIRCRGCRGVFLVPRDTAGVPLGPQESVWSLDESLPPLAIPCVIDGYDARSCPQCGRTFRMKESFAGKMIRCRGCKANFRVRASESALAEPARAAAVQPNPTAAPSRPLQPLPPPVPPPPPSPPPPPTIFEDIGDLLDDVLPGEKVASVVRPRHVPRLSAPPKSPLVIMVEMILGGVGGIAVALAILCFGMSQDPFGLFTRPVPNPMPGPVVITPPAPRPFPEPGKPPAPVPNRLRPRPQPSFDAGAFETSIKQVHLALQREDFTAADNALAAAAGHSGDSRDAKRRHKSWSLFTKYAKKFPGHRAEALKAANQGREYELDGEVFVVVEVGPDQIVYRQGGRAERERLDAMNPRKEMAIVEQWFAGEGLPENHIYLGVRWLCLNPPDLARGREQWEIADGKGAPVKDLQPLLEDPVIRDAVR